MTKTIRKIMLIVALAMWSVPASALDIEFVPASSLKGPAGTVINTIRDLSKSAGVNVIPKQMGSCGETLQYFNTTKNPVGITWSVNMYKNTAESKTDCLVNFAEAKAVAAAWTTYDVCVRKGFALESGKTYTIGNGKFNPTKSMTDHLNNNNKNIKFKNVSYEGSAQTIVGLINKDIDVGYIAAGNSAPAIKAGTIDCLYSTGSAKYGQKPLSEFTGNKDPLNEYKLGYMIFVRNLSAEQIATLEKSLSKEFHTSLEKQEFYFNRVGIDKKYLDTFVQTAKDYVKYE